MRLVELVAPAGAGKSALARAALRRHRGVLVDARALVRPGRLPGGVGLARRLPAGLARGRLRDLLLAAPTEDDIAAALRAVASPWSEFLALVAEGPTAASPSVAAGPTAERTVELALLARRWSLESLELRAGIEVALVAGVGRAGAALLDEGLLHPHKIDGAVGIDPARRERYRALVPMPALAVGLEVDPATLVARLERRATERPGHPRWAAVVAGDGLAEHVERSIEDVARTLEVAAERGTAVVRLDGTLDPAEQADRLAHELAAVSR